MQVYYKPSLYCIRWNFVERRAKGLAIMFAKTRFRYVEVPLYYIIVVGYCSEPG